MREIEKCFEYLEVGDYQRAIKSGQMAVKLYPRNINAYACLGEAYFMAGKLDLALKNFKKVEAYIKENYEYDINLYPIYNNIANIYEEKEEYDKAIEYYKKALEITEREGKYHGSGIIMLNLGGIYSVIRDFENAEYYLSEGLKRMQKLKDKLGEGLGLSLFGLYFADKGDIKSAREYLNQAYEIFKSIGEEEKASEILKNLAELEGK